MNSVAQLERRGAIFMGGAPAPRPVGLSGEAGRLRAQVLADLQAARFEAAERLMCEGLEAFPGFSDLRHDLVTLLANQNRLEEAAEQTRVLVERHPQEGRALFARGSLLSRIGRQDEALPFYAAGVEADPNQPRGWLGYGHILKTVGRLEEAVAAYRQALELAPHLGEAWWSLANLKSVKFSATDVAAMERSLGAFGLTDQDHVHLDFALGKAYEDAADYAASFRHYERGATLRRQTQPYDPQDLSSLVADCKAVLTAGLFEARKGQGCPAPDPLFIVGLPRVGSTLVEQILSSHSQVEPTHELWDILNLARELGRAGSPYGEAPYPACLADLSAETLRTLGETYLKQAGFNRHEGRPIFIDKMPNNFAHVGLIHLILPNAKIVDVRRHPMGCGFAAFKQHFAQGQNFSYDLGDIGRFYADYVELMAHFDAVLPGRIHRVVYERLIADPETEIRALLDYCGLPFEEACLRFYENGRAVRTPSAEQVRRPIYREAAEHWRNYEPWLEPLKAALGPALASYPDAPSAAANSAPTKTTPAARRKKAAGRG